MVIKDGNTFSDEAKPSVFFWNAVYYIAPKSHLLVSMTVLNNWMLWKSLGGADFLASLTSPPVQHQTSKCQT